MIFFDVSFENEKLAENYKQLMRELGTLKYVNWLELMTLFTQEMLLRGFLARDCVYVSFSHQESHVRKYLSAVMEVFTLIRKGIDAGKISKMLKSPVAHTGFTRLT